MRVEYPDGESGMAALLGGLIQANLAAHPEREALLRQPATFSINAPDVGAAVSIRLSPGLVSVAAGGSSHADVRIEGPAESLLALSQIPMRFGLPDPASRQGRDVARQLLSRRLKVRGSLMHAGKLMRLAKLLSVG